MTDSDLFSTPQNNHRENLCTCKHDVCLCVTSDICILLLIPPSRKGYYLAWQSNAAQEWANMLPVRTCISEHEGKTNPRERKEAVWVCCKFIHPFYRYKHTSCTCKNSLLHTCMNNHPHCVNMETAL